MTTSDTDTGLSLQRTEAVGAPVERPVRPLLAPGAFANYCGQRWKVGAVGFTGGERYYWLVRWHMVLMAPATMVEPWGKV